MSVNPVHNLHELPLDLGVSGHPEERQTFSPRSMPAPFVPWPETEVLIALTVAGSLLGALLLLVVAQQYVPPIVSGAMIGVALFSVIYRKSGASEFSVPPSLGAEIKRLYVNIPAGHLRRFFSGGYMTMLGALISVRLAAQLGSLWLRRIFLTAVWVLRLKTLVYDLMVKNMASCHAAPTRS